MWDGCGDRGGFFVWKPGTCCGTIPYPLFRRSQGKTLIAVGAGKRSVQYPMSYSKLLDSTPFHSTPFHSIPTNKANA